jgi:Icc-related predicted phosphoesterase
MQFGALGDIHGDFEGVRRIMRRHPEAPFWLSVGDLPGGDGRYQTVEAPLYFVQGNNENLDLIASGDLPGHLHFVPNGTLVPVAGLRVAGLGGTLAPTWYDTPSADLPHPKKGSAKATALADKRRHFVREQVDACKAMRGVDVFLTHEAPRPYRIGRLDAGKTPVNEVLAAMQPRLHLFGHHHRFTEQARQGVRSVGLDLVSKSYLLIDFASLEYHVMLL